MWLESNYSVSKKQQCHLAPVTIGLNFTLREQGGGAAGDSLNKGCHEHATTVTIGLFRVRGNTRQLLPLSKIKSGCGFLVHKLVLHPGKLRLHGTLRHYRFSHLLNIDASTATKAMDLGTQAIRYASTS